VYLLHCTWRCNILCSKHDIHWLANEWMKSTCFVFKLKRKKQILALVLIEDLGFLPLVREIQCLSTRSATLHSWKDWISHTHGRNPRSSIGTRVRTYYSLFQSYNKKFKCPTIGFTCKQRQLYSVNRSVPIAVF
jgi:hypothetical protein